MQILKYHCTVKKSGMVPSQNNQLHSHPPTRPIGHLMFSRIRRGESQKTFDEENHGEFDCCFHSFFQISSFFLWNRLKSRFAVTRTQMLLLANFIMTIPVEFFFTPLSKTNHFSHNAGNCSFSSRLRFIPAEFQSFGGGGDCVVWKCMATNSSTVMRTVVGFVLYCILLNSV